jgi:hypothetical protein
MAHSTLSVSESSAKVLHCHLSIGDERQSGFRNVTFPLTLVTQWNSSDFSVATIFKNGL